jgi:hypothetical protein
MALASFSNGSETIGAERETEEKTSMKHFLLVGALLGLMQVPVLADDRDSHESAGHSIVGSWIVQQADATGAIAFFEVGNFSPDGSYTGANVNGLHSAHKGVWVRTGHHQFQMTVLFFTHDAQGVFNGIVKARIEIAVAADLNSYDSLAERTVMDKFGNVLSITPNINGHAVRMNVELQ